MGSFQKKSSCHLTPAVQGHKPEARAIRILCKIPGEKAARGFHRLVEFHARPRRERARRAIKNSAARAENR